MIAPASRSTFAARRVDPFDSTGRSTSREQVSSCRRGKRTSPLDQAPKAAGAREARARWQSVRVGVLRSGNCDGSAGYGVVAVGAARVLGPDPEVHSAGERAGAVPVVGGAGRVALHHLPGAG